MQVNKKPDCVVQSKFLCLGWERTLEQVTGQQSIVFVSLRLCLTSSVRDNQLMLQVLDKRLICEEKFGDCRPATLSFRTTYRSHQYLELNPYRIAIH